MSLLCLGYLFVVPPPNILDTLGVCIYITFENNMKGTKKGKPGGMFSHEKMNHFCPSFNMFRFNWQTFKCLCLFSTNFYLVFLLAFMKIASPFSNIDPSSFKPRSVIKLLPRTFMYSHLVRVCFLYVVLFLEMFVKVLRTHLIVKHNNKK